MKRSIQLLTGLVLLIVAGLFYTKYQLKSQYNSIDKTDPYYAFEQITNLNYSHLKVIGGNRSNLTVESGETNTVYIKKGMDESISYEIKSDTLYIKYSESLTVETTNHQNYSNERGYSSVIIQSNSIQSINGNNASIGVDLTNLPDFESKLYGSSILEIATFSSSLQNLVIASHDVSKIKLNSSGELSSLDYLKLELADQSIAELYNIEADSIVFELDDHSRISGDANIFN